MKGKKTRELKVYGQSGYKHQEVPSIILKGKWLKSAGFNTGDIISVKVSPSHIQITKARK